MRVSGSRPEPQFPAGRVWPIRRPVMRFQLDGYAFRLTVDPFVVPMT